MGVLQQAGVIVYSKSTLLSHKLRESHYLTGADIGDEASFAQWGSLSYTWSLKGGQPVVKTSGIRRAHRLFGLFTPFEGWLLTKGTSEKSNSESFLIQDNAPYHTSGRVKDFLRAPIGWQSISCPYTRQI